MSPGARDRHDGPVDLRDAVARATERTPLADSDGRSGALLERVTLGDGRRVVVKRFDPVGDFVMRVTGDDCGREVAMWQRGFFDQLPPEVDHPILDGWYDDGVGVLVMRDLGAAVLGWDDRLDVSRCRALLRGVTALHRAFRGNPPAGLTPMEAVVGIFEPDRIAPFVGVGIVDAALRGWEYWPEVAPGEVGEQVLELVQDSRRLVKSYASLEPTLLHGDLATVNMAFEGDQLTLIDWGVATAGPSAVDIGRFLVGCAHVLDVTEDEFLALYREEAGEVYDARATSLGLLGALVWLGWNKSLDIVESPDATVRERERATLRWWLDRAGEAFEAGL
jgi:hypothetical protein